MDGYMYVFGYACMYVCSEGAAGGWVNVAIIEINSGARFLYKLTFVEVFYDLCFSFLRPLF